jgi:hypothetical protein
MTKYLEIVRLMPEVVLCVAWKQGFDVTTKRGKKYFETITTQYGEEVPLEQDLMWQYPYFAFSGASRSLKRS